MAETITPAVKDKNCSLMRVRSLNTGEAKVWTTSPGFQYAIAYDLVKNGVIYKTIYEIFGEGLPSTNYASATAGSTYTDTVYGHEYRALLDDDLTLMWALTVNIILQTEGDTAISNIDLHPMGQLVADSNDSAKLYIKVNASTTAGLGTSEIVGDQAA